MTGLTTKGLDLLSATMCAIPNQGVDVSIGDAEVRALLVGTGEALGLYPFGSSPPAFDLAPGAHRKRCWFGPLVEGGGEAAGWTITRGAWLEEALDRGVYGPYSRVERVMTEPVQVPKPRQAE